MRQYYTHCTPPSGHKCRGRGGIAPSQVVVVREVVAAAETSRRYGPAEGVMEGLRTALRPSLKDGISAALFIVGRFIAGRRWRLVVLRPCHKRRRLGPRSYCREVPGDLMRPAPWSTIPLLARRSAARLDRMARPVRSLLG